MRNLENQGKLIRIYYHEEKLALRLQSEEYIEVRGILLKSCLVRAWPFGFFMGDIEREAPKRADSYFVGDLVRLGVGFADRPCFEQRIKYWKIENWDEINRKRDEIENFNLLGI